ncbi:N-terminal glutamine amidase-domain-containing protein [Cokeromyces recurvatus]|uniref:N-terminal glutamine amidase-domain-containing protein n=1 Tax=Cokeromyces recurvatus TaxID=90255 RepID=UPI00221F50F3|nr:N-terminal glutamine amidase-domain-containing protein [Cokeromyces recurvatus]KAI7901679.1 N-terminal glutamine amidase-domain-containing protein [Cokeromyces recurvatus]
MLCTEIKRTQPELLKNFFVVFISNEKRSVPLWKQLAGIKNDRPFVIWDYHVILYYRPAKLENSLIYDFDTTLPFPCQALEYVKETFKPDLFLKEEYKHHFRLISAQLYLDYFQSDRSHMLKEDGTYMAPPPSYQAIISSENGTSNLDYYISMKPHSSVEEKYGVVYESVDFFMH